MMSWIKSTVTLHVSSEQHILGSVIVHLKGGRGLEVHGLLDKDCCNTSVNVLCWDHTRLSAITLDLPVIAVIRFIDTCVQDFTQ